MVAIIAKLVVVSLLCSLITCKPTGKDVEVNDDSKNREYVTQAMICEYCMSYEKNEQSGLVNANVPLLKANCDSQSKINVVAAVLGVSALPDLSQVLKSANLLGDKCNNYYKSKTQSGVGLLSSIGGGNGKGS